MEKPMLLFPVQAGTAAWAFGFELYIFERKMGEYIVD